MHNENQVGKVHPVFLQFGFKEVELAIVGNQAIGNCPFCGDLNHFYVAKDSKNSTWDCKKCGVQGGYKVFVSEMIKFSQKAFNKFSAKALCDSRGLSFETFRLARVGYHPFTKQYIVPSYGENEELLSAKIFDIQQNTFNVIAGQTLFMYSPPAQACTLQNAKVVPICEGEWDSLALFEVFRSLKVNDHFIIGRPGSGVFKTEILPFLEGKEVLLFGDNDAPGQKGDDKAEKLITNARSLKRIKWPLSYKPGYDVRDVYTKMYKCQPKPTWERLKFLLAPVVQHSVEETTTLIGRPIPCTQVYSVFRKWLHLPSTELLDVIFGVAISNRIPGDPCWMLIVAPPGATKTEPLMTFTGSPLVETLSSLTSCTLISGARVSSSGYDPSLIPRLKNKILVIKDFTAVLGLPAMEFDEIISILRDAYDGECKKPFGTGVVKAYSGCHFTIIAAVTPIVEEFTEGHPAVGERFLRWSNNLSDNPDDRKVFIRKALENVSKELVMRLELKEIAHAVLAADYGEIPTIPKVIEDRVVDLSQLVAMLRASPSRDKYHREIIHKSYYELATRIVKEMYKLILGVSMFRGRKEATEAEYNVAVHVGRSSITRRIYDTINIIYNKGECTITELSELIVLPTVTCRTITENLFTMGVLTKNSVEEDNKIHWKIKSNVLKMIQTTSFCRKELKYANKNEPK